MMELYGFILDATGKIPAWVLGWSAIGVFAFGIVIWAKGDWMNAPLPLFLAFCLTMGWLFKQKDV